jgi:hypothetical protein
MGRARTVHRLLRELGEVRRSLGDTGRAALLQGNHDLVEKAPGAIPREALQSQKRFRANC